MEVALFRRPTADRHRAARVDPADSIENPLWGETRIHSELLKLGFEVAQSSVAKYMAKRREPRSQGWRTFLRNHATDIAAMDFFVVPTIGFDLLYAFVIVRRDRRDLVMRDLTQSSPSLWLLQLASALSFQGLYVVADILRNERPSFASVFRVDQVLTMDKALRTRSKEQIRRVLDVELLEAGEARFAEEFLRARRPHAGAKSRAALRQRLRHAVE